MTKEEATLGKMDKSPFNRNKSGFNFYPLISALLIFYFAINQEAVELRRKEY